MLLAFAVFDSKAAAYGMPMFLSNKGLAIRGFSDAAVDPQSAIAKHPGDYVLYQVGTYDQNSGDFVNISPAIHIVSASSVVALAQPAAAAAPVLDLPAGKEVK